jgi:hypothetical protein
MTSYLRFGTITLLLLCTSTMAVVGRLTLARSDDLVPSDAQEQLIWRELHAGKVARVHGSLDSCEWLYDVMPRFLPLAPFLVRDRPTSTRC